MGGRDTVVLAVADMTEEDLSAASKSRATDATKVVTAVATAFANLRTTLQLVLQHHRIGVLRVDTVVLLLDVRSQRGPPWAPAGDAYPAKQPTIRSQRPHPPSGCGGGST